VLVAVAVAVAVVGTAVAVLKHQHDVLLAWHHNPTEPPAKRGFSLMPRRSDKEKNSAALSRNLVPIGASNNSCQMGTFPASDVSVCWATAAELTDTGRSVSQCSGRVTVTADSATRDRASER
jgi:hypothetical protein